MVALRSQFMAAGITGESGDALRSQFVVAGVWGESGEKY